MFEGVSSEDLGSSQVEWVFRSSDGKGNDTIAWIFFFFFFFSINFGLFTFCLSSSSLSEHISDLDGASLFVHMSSVLVSGFWLWFR